MDVFYVLRGQTFVWDALKATDNFHKHGIRFEHACEVFFDPDATDEDASVQEEARLAVIGSTSDDRILYVVNVDRGEDWIRIVSARTATRREQRFYENGI